MILLNLIQVVLIAIWTLLFCYVITLLLPPKATLWLAVRLWAPVTIFLTMSRLKVEGLENLDPKKHYIFMANHSSFFDIPAIFWGSRRELHFMVKEELKHNIFTGFVCKKMHMIFIDRSNAQKTTSSMRKAIELISEGMDIVIYPEGTRTKTGELGVFRKGGFKLAINSQTDIVPVTIKKSAKAWSRNNIRFSPTIVTVHFDKPISVQGVEERDAAKISAQVFETIKQELQK